MSDADVTPEHFATTEEIDDAIEYIKAAWGTGHRFYRSLYTLRAELDRLRSAPVAAEVPEMSPEDLLSVFARVEVDVENSGGRYGVWEAKRLTEWFRERIKPIPSDRVLKEGEVAVSSEEWEAANALSDAMSSWIAVRCNPMAFGHVEAVIEAANKLIALRSGEAEGRMG